MGVAAYYEVLLVSDVPHSTDRPTRMEVGTINTGTSKENDHFFLPKKKGTIPRFPHWRMIGGLY